MSSNWWDGLDSLKPPQKLGSADTLRLEREIESVPAETSADKLRKDMQAGNVAGPPGYQPPNVEQQAAAGVNTQLPSQGAQPPPIPAKETVTTTQQQPPPAMMPVQTTVTRNVMDPKTLKEQEKITDQKLAAADAKTAADIAQNNAIAAEQANRAAMMQREADQQTAINARRQEMAQQKMAAVDKAIADFNANSQIDPQRFQKRMGVGGQILATISKAFGAFGSALTHSPNYAAQEIQRAIDADIEAQRHDVQMLGQKVNFANNQYQMFRNQGLDDDAARAATRMLKLQQSAAQIDRLLAETKNPQLQAQGAQMKAEILDSANKTKMEYGKTQIGTVNQPQGGPGGASIEDVTKLMGAAREHPLLKKFEMAQDASDRFRSLMAAKADGAAVMDFIATGMKQGSFTPTFIDMLAKRSAGGSLMERIRAAAKGGYDPELMKTLQRALDGNLATATSRAEPVIKQLGAMGAPRSLIIGGQTVSDKAAALGGQRAE